MAGKVIHINLTLHLNEDAYWGCNRPNVSKQVSVSVPLPLFDAGKTVKFIEGLISDAVAEFPSALVEFAREQKAEKEKAEAEAVDKEQPH